MGELLKAFHESITEQEGLLLEILEYFWAVGDSSEFAADEDITKRFGGPYLDELENAVKDVKWMSMADQLLSSELEHFCNQACAWPIFQVLGESQGCEPLDVDVGPRGKRLSGGQQQLLCIARIFIIQEYRNAPIIVLDEPAAALDLETSRELGHQLTELTYQDDEAAERATVAANAAYKAKRAAERESMASQKRRRRRRRT